MKEKKRRKAEEEQKERKGADHVEPDAAAKVPAPNQRKGRGVPVENCFAPAGGSGGGGAPRGSLSLKCKDCGYVHGVNMLLCL